MTQSKSFEIKSKEALELSVKEKHEQFLAEERAKVNLLVKKALEELEGQMLYAKKQGITYDQAEVKGEIDLTDFSEPIKEELYKKLQSAGWSIYFATGRPGAIWIKPY